ncbi:MAG: hypothetical protein JW870_11025 [Candidatus Delongbacteria bacterium]|nr:hypothetical protein [Candidatus Delongbacteria bacterium]
MKNFAITIMVIFIASVNLFAQKKELPKSNQVHILKEYDERYAMLNNYLIENNFIEKENDSIYLFNLLSWKEFDLADSCGIYVFGIKFQEPTFFLFFENRDKSYSIIRKNSLPLILNTTTVFFEQNEIKNMKTQLFYTLSLLKFFDADNEYLIEEKYLSRNWNL